MGFSRQEYWSGLPSPSPGDLPDLGIEPGSPALQTDVLPSDPPGKPHNIILLYGLSMEGEEMQRVMLNYVQENFGSEGNSD